ncbi:MAG: BMP family protein [Planctomycetes bacterium]|nr:BMP family protein [Planctomycetota bacterium]
MKGQTVGIAVTVLVVIALVWAFSGPAHSPSPPGAFSAALITPGDVTDGGWSQSAYTGLKQIEKELGARVQNATAQASGLSSALDSLRTYLGEGTNVVFLHAGEWWRPQLVELAGKHPKAQIFVSGNDKDAEGNVAGLRFVLEDACYVLGYLAGKLTKSGVLGCVGPKKHPVIESTFEAFAAGAKEARPDADVRIVWTDSWDDVAKAKEQTLALIGQNADLIFHNANNGARGVFEAVQEHKDKGVLAFGSNDDQNALFPETILASAVLDIPKTFLDVAAQVKAGSFDGKTQIFGLPEGYVWVAFNPKLDAKIPAETKQACEALIAKIKSRAFEVPRKSLK